MPIEREGFSKDLKCLNMKLREKAFIQNYSYTHEQKPGRNGLFTREEKRTNVKVRLKHEEINFGKEKMKGEKNMREWRRLEERQDHNEGHVVTNPPPSPSPRVYL